MIYSYKSIRAVHLEITDRCNAACPMCPRYVHGEEAPYVQNVQLSLDDIQTIFPVDFVQQLNRINFCGNYGDPIVARDLIPVIRYFRSINSNMRIEVNTNASARREEWWTELAQVMGSDEATSGVWFGLDGLGDTNHLYRRNTNWDNIMRNAKAFIAAGGIAHWNFIAFKHNEHQIPIAQAMAKEMGFKHFNIKLTARFGKNNTYPVYIKGEHAYDLEPPAAEDPNRPPPVNHNRPHRRGHNSKVAIPSDAMSDAMLGAMKVIAEHKKNKGDITPSPIPKIDCIAQKEDSIYVSATGLVYPCCWIADGHIQLEPELARFIDVENLDITKRSIEDIINSKEFQTVEDSWELGSIRKCVNICSVKVEKQDESQYGPEMVIHGRVDGRE